MTTESAASQPGPLLVDLAGLRAMASDPIVRRGMAYFKEERVTDLDWDDRHIWAQVEGSDPSSPYFVEIWPNEDDELAVDCDCPFDWEPVCKHAVAALLAYSARQPVSEIDVTNASDKAVADRVHRGKTEVVVTEPANGSWLGTWTARSVTREGVAPRAYRVEIRSLTERANHCTCPDLATNMLGTCKHIEAALHRIRHLKKSARSKGGEPAGPAFVYLGWDCPEPPEIRIRRRPNMPDDLRAVVDEHFDDSGVIRGPVTSSLWRFEDLVYGREDIVVGSDALAHADQLVAEAAGRERGAEIRAQILASGSHLPGVRARLYPYQVEGVAFLASKGRALLADDMGLGKTLQAIAAAAYLMGNKQVRTAVIVTPASLKDQWVREIERFTDASVVKIQGPKLARRAQYRQRANFTVVNYELVMRDAHDIGELLAPDLLILDEAQRIKNWRTKTAATIKSLSTRYAFVLTGTPLENRLEDLYSIAQVVEPRVLGPLWRFMLDFHVLDPRGTVLGYRNLSELRRRISPVMLRRDRGLVRDQLPDKIVSRMDVAMTPAQTDVHDGAIAAAGSLARILKRRPLTPSEQNRLLAALQQARMACNAIGLIDGETKGSPKLDELKELLADLCTEQGRKVVVFSQWERMTKLAEDVADELGIGSVRLHGGVPTAKRGDLITRFLEDPEIRIFFSTDAGGVGLNLQSASVLINLDLPWNPAVLEQRIGRVHRLGQAEPVQVFLIVAANSYEERVAALMATKRQLFDNTVADGDEDVVGLSRTSLQWLVEEASPEGGAADEVQESTGDEPNAEATQGEALRAEEGEVSANKNEGGDSMASPTMPDNGELNRVVAELEQLFGARLERVLGAQGGLLAIVSSSHDEDDRRVASIDASIAVGVIDARTAAQLSRVGALGIPRSLYQRAPDEARQDPMVSLAQRKLRAAESLVAADCGGEAVAMLGAAMLAVASHRAQAAQLPSDDRAAIWLYATALPAGAVSPEEAAAIGRVLALQHAASVPADLAELMLTDARRMVAAVAIQVEA